MDKTQISEAQFDKAQDKIDSLTRKFGSVRSAATESQESISEYKAALSAWETALALPQRKASERQERDAALLSVANKFSLLA